MTMLRAIVSSGGSPPKNVKELEELFGIIAPVFREEHAVPPKEHTAREVDLLKGLGVMSAAESFGPIAEDGPVDAERTSEMQEESNLVSKLVHMLDHEDTDIAFQMLSVARNHLGMGGKSRVGYTLVPVVFSALRLVDRMYAEEYPPPKPQEEEKTEEAVISELQKGEETKEEGESPGMKDEGKPESADDGEAQGEAEEAASSTEKEDAGEVPGMKDEGKPESADDGEAQGEAEEAASSTKKEDEGEVPKVETAADDSGHAEVNDDLDTKESAVMDTPASDVSHHEQQKDNGAELSRKKTIR
jgi:vacuolar protein sorting-associated protein 35